MRRETGATKPNCMAAARKSTALLALLLLLSGLPGCGQQRVSAAETTPDESTLVVPSSEEEGISLPDEPEPTAPPEEPEPTPEPREHEFYFDHLPEQYYSECPEAGEYYTTVVEPGVQLTVYLPYGYNEDTPYDLLLIIPGLNGWSKDAIGADFTSPRYENLQGHKVFDWAIYQGLCKPTIIVSITPPNSFSMKFVKSELLDGVFPYILENLSTYAEGTTMEDVKAAREHFALAGVSQGAGYVYWLGMGEMFEYFGSYAAIAGEFGNAERAWEGLRSEKYRDLPVGCFYVAGGSLDKYNLRDGQAAFAKFTTEDERFVEGENAFSQVVEGGHNWFVWIPCLFNALQLLFPD